MDETAILRCERILALKPAIDDARASGHPWTAIVEAVGILMKVPQRPACEGF